MRPALVSPTLPFVNNTSRSRIDPFSGQNQGRVAAEQASGPCHDSGMSLAHTDSLRDSLTWPLKGALVRGSVVRRPRVLCTRQYSALAICNQGGI